jgi:hypothetical protein
MKIKNKEKETKSRHILYLSAYFLYFDTNYKFISSLHTCDFFLSNLIYA